jgi:ankyrin repeat protein
MWLRRRWNAQVLEAIARGDAERLRVLHRRGFRMNARSRQGESYLHRVAAIRLGWAGHVADTLIELGADVNAAMRTQSRPLHTAALAGNRDVAEVLLNFGADINTATAYGFTALHYAVGNDEREVVKLLLTRGANLGVLTSGGQTPLAIAERNEAWEIAELLWDTQFPPRPDRAAQTRFRFTAADTCTIH